MGKWKYFNLLFLISVSFTLQLTAQTGKYISINEALDLAAQSNSNTKIAALEKRISNANYRQTDAVFLPQVDLNYTALSTNNPLNAFGFLLQQSVVTTADFDPSQLSSPGSVQDYSAKVEVRQPIINLDMIYARKGAKNQEEVYKYKEERTKQHIAFEVKKAYLQLQFSYKAQDILQNSLQQVSQIYQSVYNFYQQGLVQKSDVLNAQVQVNTIESALAKAKSGIYNASDGLQILIGENTTETYLVDDFKQNEAVFSGQLFSTSRADIMAMNKAIEATNTMVKSAKMAFLPKLNAFGSYQLNDSKAFRFDADSYLVGISLSWNIFSGNQNRYKVKSYQYQKAKMEEELNLYIRQSQLEIDKTKRNLYDSQIEINKQNMSVKQAEEALRIIENRYKEGLVNTTDLLMAQGQLSQQNLLLAQAILSYNITLAYLDFLIRID